MQALIANSPFGFTALVFLFALLIGSFLNVVIYRLPVMMERAWRKEATEILADPPAGDLPEGRFDLIAPRSRCRHCGAQITALQNIPVVSYLLLGGKCAGCKAPISIRYPVVELSTAILSAAVAWRFGFGVETLAAVFMTWMLIAISVIDIDHQIIPDSLVLPLMWVGLILSLFHPLDGSRALFVDPATSIIGAVAGYMSLWSVYQLFRIVTGKEGMGYGDFKLLAAFGAWLGWQVLPLIVLLSAVVGAVVGIAMIAFRGHDRNVPIPFGPYLAAAGWIAMLFGDDIITAYLGLF
jgi:leader peptidase (prepilin peptidase)/N-methyltransferase